MSGNKLDIVLSYRQEYVVTGPVSACNGQLIKNLSNSERAIVRVLVHLAAGYIDVVKY